MDYILTNKVLKPLIYKFNIKSNPDVRLLLNMVFDTNTYWALAIV